MMSPSKQNCHSDSHIEQAGPVSSPRQADDIEEAKESALNEVCLSTKWKSITPKPFLTIF